MPDDDPLVPADPNDVLNALSFALSHDGRRRYRQAENVMASVVAAHLLEHLTRSNFVVMRKPGAPDHGVDLAHSIGLAHKPETGGKG